MRGSSERILKNSIFLNEISTTKHYKTSGYLLVYVVFLLTCEKQGGVLNSINTVWRRNILFKISNCI